jgi:radical SAM superfamily enzyme YgiQ (UPF0313 family)
VADIVLTTLNAKYIHAAFGLRYLLANLGELRPSAALLEFDINQRPLDIAEMLLAREPKIIGFGVYIWNVAPTTEVVAAIKRLRPEIKIILGGPEVSYETEGQPIVELADHVITGEADLKFAEVCRVLFGRAELLLGQDAQQRVPTTLPKIIAAAVPDFSKIVLPYDLYTDEDLAHRIIYVEASRGCPFTCEFCLSSLDIPVRQVPLEKFLTAMQKLLDRGVKQFKFVDRTFNLNIANSKTLLEFFLARHRPGHFYHFEMIPDRLPAELREIIARFPPGTLQFEVGIQTFNPEVEKNISRRQNYDRLADNFNFLRRETGVHIHADLIVGLPGETLASFGTGFDKLIALGPQEIQVGILKRLRGTPIVRHDSEWQMIYSAQPPYEILQNRLIDFASLQRLRRFARYWDMVGNSGNFLESTPLVWTMRRTGVASALCADPVEPQARHYNNMFAPPSPFHSFLHFSDWLFTRIHRTDSIALLRLMELLFEFLTAELGLDPKLVAETLWRDYKRGGRHDKPGFIKSFLTSEEPLLPPAKTKNSLPKRQARHLV